MFCPIHAYLSEKINRSLWQFCHLKVLMGKLSRILLKWHFYFLREWRDLRSKSIGWWIWQLTKWPKWRSNQKNSTFWMTLLNVPMLSSGKNLIYQVNPNISHYIKLDKRTWNLVTNYKRISNFSTAFFSSHFFLSRVKTI